jgi:hypothetical protein
VRFHAEHRIHGSQAAVAALLVNADFYLHLALPDLSLPQVVEERAEGDEARLRLRYEFVGSLDPIAQRLLGSSRLAWIQEVRVDGSAGTGTLAFEAEKDPKRLQVPPTSSSPRMAAAPSGRSTASWWWQCRASVAWRSERSCPASCAGWTSRRRLWTKS